MSATLTLDRFELMWLCEGAIGKSHLRWGIYSLMVDSVWPQLTDLEREAIFTYIKRDNSWLFKGDTDRYETPRNYYLQMLARYNPANQFKITLKDGRMKVTEDAYKWNGRYYVSWQRFCDPDHIRSIEQKPYRKCTNDRCDSAANDTCLRYKTHNEGDILLSCGAPYKCKHCDFVIACEGMTDPVAEIVITPEQDQF